MVDPASVRPGIYVASPIYGAECYMPYVTGLLSLQRACIEAGIGFNYFYVSGTALLHEQRNVAAAAFMHHSDLSHMLYLDADIGFEGADIIRMFAEQQDLVLGPYPAKHINWRAVVQMARQRPDLPAEEIALSMADYSTNFYGLGDKNTFVNTGLNEIYGGGAGLMLIARSTLSSLDRAYPAYRSNFPEAYKHLVPNVDTLVEYFGFDREEDGRLLSEDLTFCKRWREIGGRVYAAPWVRTAHVGPFYFRGELPTLLGSNQPALRGDMAEDPPQPVVQKAGRTRVVTAVEPARKIIVPETLLADGNSKRRRTGRAAKGDDDQA